MFKPPKGRAKFPYGPVNNLSKVLQDPQVKFNEMEMTMEHNYVGMIKQVAIGLPVILVNQILKMVLTTFFVIGCPA